MKIRIIKESAGTNLSEGDYEVHSDYEHQAAQDRERQQAGEDATEKAHSKEEFLSDGLLAPWISQFELEDEDKEASLKMIRKTLSDAFDSMYDRTRYGVLDF